MTYPHFAILFGSAALLITSLGSSAAAQPELEAPPVSVAPELLELDDPATPLSFDFPDLDRLARPTGFSNLTEESFQLIVFRSGRQIYLYEDIGAGAISDGADPTATFYEHETDAGLARGIRDALVESGASQEAADSAIGELQDRLDRPYGWQALCFRVGETVEVQGIAGVR
ncbi:MAG: hypothetical protein ACJAYU_000998 [Bradymonadia bacterium]|jgi:hypothetical protein